MHKTLEEINKYIYIPKKLCDSGFSHIISYFRALVSDLGTHIIRHTENLPSRNNPTSSPARYFNLRINKNKIKILIVAFSTLAYQA